jgi:hypothetical protein
MRTKDTDGGKRKSAFSRLTNVELNVIFDGTKAWVEGAVTFKSNEYEIYEPFEVPQSDADNFFNDLAIVTDELERNGSEYALVWRVYVIDVNDPMEVDHLVASGKVLL